MKNKEKSTGSVVADKEDKKPSKKSSKKTDSPSIILTRSRPSGESNPPHADGAGLSKKKKYRSLRLRREKHNIPAAAAVVAGCVLRLSLFGFSTYVVMVAVAFVVVASVVLEVVAVVVVGVGAAVAV
jgi:hypothetical protein